MDLNKIARERMAADWGHQVELQAGKAVAASTTTVHEDALALKRLRNKEANKRYRKTEKGRLNNMKQCKKYFERHKDQCRQHAMTYSKEFYEKYGVWFSAWNYWRKKLLAGKCKLADIPEQYGKILNDWMKRQNFKENEND